MRYVAQILFFFLLPFCSADIEISNELDRPITIYAETECNPTDFFIENMDIPAHTKKSVDSSLISQHVKTVCLIINLVDKQLISVENISDFSECSISVTKQKDSYISQTSNKCQKTKKI